MREIFRKKIQKTDKTKRLSVPSKKKKCFLDFGEQQNMVKFDATDENGERWSFECSKRKGKYPKPVLSKGWLPFVRQRNLAVGDEVAFYVEHDKAGKCRYIIEVTQKADRPPVQNHNAHGTMETASYNDTKEEPAPTITSYSADQSITDDQADEVPYQPVTDIVGSIFVIASSEPDGQVRELQFIDFFERAKEQPREPQFIDFFERAKEQPRGTTSSTPPF